MHVPTEVFYIYSFFLCLDDENLVSNHLQHVLFNFVKRKERKYINKSQGHRFQSDCNSQEVRCLVKNQVDFNVEMKSKHISRIELLKQWFGKTGCCRKRAFIPKRFTEAKVQMRKNIYP